MDVSELKNLDPVERVARLKEMRDQKSSDEKPPRFNTSPRPRGDAEKPLVDAAEEAQQESKPRKRTASRSNASTDGQRYKPGMFVEPLEGIYTAIGMGVSAFDKHEVEDEAGNKTIVPLCGFAIASNAHSIATQWDSLAETNPQVRRALMKLLQGGAWAGVIGAHLPILGAIISNHMPGLMPGVVPKDGESA